MGEFGIYSCERRVSWEFYPKIEKLIKTQVKCCLAIQRQLLRNSVQSIEAKSETF